MYAIIVAAGKGQRFASDTPKQFLEIAGKMVVQHSIDAFDKIDEIEGIVVVMPKQQALWKNIELTASKPLMYATGGSSRLSSVLHGLQILEPLVTDNSWILVHDAARVCVKKSDIKKLIQSCKQQNQGGLLVKPITDTIKFSKDGKNADKTINRDNLYSALTPQMFPYGQLVDVLKKADEELTTDEASAFEQAGIRPLLVKGRSDNFKITYADDLLLASFILRKGQ